MNANCPKAGFVFLAQVKEYPPAVGGLWFESRRRQHLSSRLLEDTESGPFGNKCKGYKNLGPGEEPGQGLAV